MPFQDRHQSEVAEAFRCLTQVLSSKINLVKAEVLIQHLNTSKNDNGQVLKCILIKVKGPGFQGHFKDYNKSNTFFENVRSRKYKYLCKSVEGKGQRLSDKCSSKVHIL